MATKCRRPSAWKNPDWVAAKVALIEEILPQVVLDPELSHRLHLEFASNEDPSSVLSRWRGLVAALREQGREGA